MPTPLYHLSCQMACKMPLEPQHSTILHPWGYPCLGVIEKDFVFKGVEQFGPSSQEKDLGTRGTWCC